MTKTPERNYTLYQDTHNELENRYEAVPVTKKFTDFLAGIFCPLLKVGLHIAMSDPLKLSHFYITQQFSGTLVANQANHNRIKNDERGILTVETYRKSNKIIKGKGGKGKGG